MQLRKLVLVDVVRCDGHDVLEVKEWRSWSCGLWVLGWCGWWVMSEVNQVEGKIED